MNKKAVIKEVIEDLLKIRQKRYDELIDACIEQEWALDALNDGYSTSTWREIIGAEKKDEKDIWNEFETDFDVPLVKLNNLLSEAERNDEVLEIEKRMARLHSKQFIGVKDFAEKYNDSPSTQKQYRSRLYDPLPYHQKVAGGKIMYIVDEVEKWRANNDK